MSDHQASYPIVTTVKGDSRQAPDLVERNIQRPSGGAWPADGVRSVLKRLGLVAVLMVAA